MVCNRLVSTEHTIRAHLDTVTPFPPETDSSRKMSGFIVFESREKNDDQIQPILVNSLHFSPKQPRKKRHLIRAGPVRTPFVAAHESSRLWVIVEMEIDVS